VYKFKELQLVSRGRRVLSVARKLPIDGNSKLDTKRHMNIV
jgi:hypothetical protein